MLRVECPVGLTPQLEDSTEKEGEKNEFALRDF